MLAIIGWPPCSLLSLAAVCCSVGLQNISHAVALSSRLRRHYRVSILSGTVRLTMRLALLAIAHSRKLLGPSRCRCGPPLSAGAVLMHEARGRSTP